MRSIPLSAMLLVLLGLLVGACAETEDRGPVVLAPSSTQEAIEAIADAWEAAGHTRPVLSFSSTPSVVRHVSEGAPADVVITADSEWMDWLDQQGQIEPDSRYDIASNSLVFVWTDMHLQQPTKRSTREVPYQARRVAIADPENVPAGRYARLALLDAGLWGTVSEKIVPTDNVRLALALVEQGEADLGIVYASDLHGTAGLLSEPLPLPDGAEVRYPAALTRQSQHPDAQVFLAFLSGRRAQAIFCEFGFVRLEEQVQC